MIGVVGMFSLAGLCIACTLVRTVVIGTTAADVATVALWTSFEQATGIIVVCMPALESLTAKHEAPRQETPSDASNSWIRMEQRKEPDAKIFII